MQLSRRHRWQPSCRKSVNWSTYGNGFQAIVSEKCCVSHNVFDQSVSHASGNERKRRDRRRGALALGYLTVTVEERWTLGFATLVLAVVLSAANIIGQVKLLQTICVTSSWRLPVTDVCQSRTFTLFMQYHMVASEDVTAYSLHILRLLTGEQY